MGIVEVENEEFNNSTKNNSNNNSWIENAKNKALPQSMESFKYATAVDRDPKNLHSEVLINFEDIIAEPQGYHSAKYTWNMSHTIYDWGKKNAYEFTSCLFGVPMSFFWGCLYALIACLHVWIYAPMKRSQSIKANCWRGCWGTCIKTCFDPLFDSAGKVFSNVDIHTEKVVIE